MKHAAQGQQACSPAFLGRRPGTDLGYKCESVAEAYRGPSRRLVTGLDVRAVNERHELLFMNRDLSRPLEADLRGVCLPAWGRGR
jgi:hypothetical protein